VTAIVKPRMMESGERKLGGNFERPDLNNADLFNLVLWKAIIGDDKPYPEWGP
jgi:hypothetical protein